MDAGIWASAGVLLLMGFDVGEEKKSAEALELQDVVKGEENTKVPFSVLCQAPLLLYWSNQVGDAAHGLSLILALRAKLGGTGSGCGRKAAPVPWRRRGMC